MAVKYKCDVTGEQFKKEEIDDKVFTCTIVISAGLTTARIGSIHVKKEVLSKEMQEVIEKNENAKKYDIIVSVTGRIVPSKKAYVYKNKNPSINGVNITPVFNNNTKQNMPILKSYNYNKNDPQIKQFIEEIEDEVIQICEKQHNQAQNMSQEKQQPRGSMYS